MTKPTIIKRMLEHQPVGLSQCQETLMRISGYNRAVDDLEPLEIDLEKLAKFLETSISNSKRKPDYVFQRRLDPSDGVERMYKQQEQIIGIAQSIKTAIESGEILKEVEK
jgi:hypothetical protein